MNEERDWYPTDLATERVLYGNIDAKIDGYAAKYPVLTVDYLKSLHTMCDSFTEGYDKTEQNRATGKQMTKWFTKLVRSKVKVAVPPAPVFLEFEMPAGALTGVEQQCREFARLLKSQPNYDEADGLDLMIEKAEGTARDISTAVPEMKLTVSPDGVVTNDWKKDGFDMLEWQYRRAGEQMWQLADKSTEKTITFKPTLTTPGVPEKFEFRAVYILKNMRVGQWSTIYVLTVG